MTSMGFNSGFSEAEMFLATLQSEDSSDGDKSDYNGYGLLQESPDQSMGNYGAWNNKQEPNLTPESFHSGVADLAEPRAPTRPAQDVQAGPGGVSATPLQQISSFGSSSSYANGFDVSAGVNAGAPDSAVRIKEDASPELSLEPHELRELLADGSHEAQAGSVGGPGCSKVFKPKRERTSHNVIEKKYRTNINDKILQLRDIVPTLRVATKREAGLMITAEDHEELDGLDPARKLNKASILVKTIEYIRHLENKCEAYKYENTKLRSGQAFTTPESDRHASAGYSELAPTGIQQAPTQSTPYANAYPTTSKDMTSKFLMGGLALTMGASCFGEGNDYDNAKGLMSLPVFHYSPASGFTMTNANGVINLPTALLSLFRIFLLFATAFHLLSSLALRFRQGKDKTREFPVVQFADTVCLGTGLVDTLKKTMIINRLKYPVNSIERIESEIANCFALKLYNPSFPLNVLAARHIDFTWSKIKEQVETANKRSKGALKNGIEWEMITNVLTTSKDDTLSRGQLLEALARKGTFTLEGLVEFINNFLVKTRNESVVVDLLEETCASERPIKEVVENVFETEVFNNEKLQLSSDNFVMLRCLFENTESNIDSLLKLVKANTGLGSEKGFNHDQVLVLYSSIVQNLISQNQLKQAYHWVSKISPELVNTEEVSIVGVAAVFLLLRSLRENDADENVQSIYPRLESLSGKLRVWLGSATGGCLNLGLRGKLVDFCVDTTLKCGMTAAKELEEDTDVEEDLDEVSDDEAGDL